ncbi:MAG: ribosome biogenesis factor YjgA, partial [Pseudomonadales bacterium]|nr:ribosome biogenesis factor YjgA [Pseudomonadales bacterium]
KEYKRITKGNARKRQMLYIGKLLRQVDLAAIEDLIDRYDSSSDAHRLLVHQFESWRLRLLASDPLVITELGERYSELDRQALRTIVRDAQAEQAVAEGTSTKAYRKLFQHLKRLHDQQLLADATMGAPNALDEDLEDPAL